jgi:uncharacterized protein related to proFAR isomerase
MSIDFELIKKLELEIKELLEQRPEYKDWFYALRKEIDEKAGKDKHNRCVVSLDLALKSLHALNDNLQKLRSEQ